VTSLDIAQYARVEARDGGSISWNLPIDHWSPSSLAMLNRCPRQWQERYIHGRKERPGEALVVGTAVHAGVERNFEQKIRTQEDLPIVDLLDWYVEVGWEETLEREAMRNGQEPIWDNEPAKARDRGKAMLSEYHNVVAPRVQPLSVEGWVEVDLGAYVPVQGRYDVVRSSSVIDVKTGKSKTTKPKEAWRIQAAVYSEAEGKPVEFHNASMTKTGVISIVTPLEAETLLVHPSKEERAELRRTIRALSTWAVFLMEAYGPDEPWPTTGRFHTWACDYCGFRGDCPAWRGAA